MPVEVLQDGAAAVVRLNWPEKRNALGPAEADEITDAIRRAAASRAAVVLCGAGAFCAGGDLRTIAELSERLRPDEIQDQIYGRVQAMIRALGDVAVPTIAAVDGRAIGLGMDLMLACDVRLVGRQAGRCRGGATLGSLPLPAACGSFQVRAPVCCGGFWPTSRGWTAPRANGSAGPLLSTAAHSTPRSSRPTAWGVSSAPPCSPTWRWTDRCAGRATSTSMRRPACRRRSSARPSSGRSRRAPSAGPLDRPGPPTSAPTRLPIRIGRNSELLDTGPGAASRPRRPRRGGRIAPTAPSRFARHLEHPACGGLASGFHRRLCHHLPGLEIHLV